MTDEELRARLVASPNDTPVEATPSVNPVCAAAEKVMASYQNANKWLDSIKEYLLMCQGCVFFSNYIHNLAHTMPARFDKFGDILHTVDMIVPYPATSAIECMPTDIPSTFQQVFSILGCICNSLKEFIRVTQDDPAVSCSSEDLLVDISGEFTNLYRMQRAYAFCGGDNIKFDKWVAHYVGSLGSLID